MKIIIAGDGKVGSTLVSQLTVEGHDITIIDTDRSVLDLSLEQYDIMAVEGNCATMEALKHADITNADLLIAVTGFDEINLLCCMTAHAMNNNIHTIARIRNPEYSEQIYAMRDMFALSMVVNPEKMAAVEIGRLLKYPGFLKRDTFSKGRVEIVELKVDQDSKLCDVSLSQLGDIVKCKVLVCTVVRNGRAFTPDGSFVLKNNDRIFVTAPSENLTILLKNLGIIPKKAKTIIIAGGGKISYYLAQILEKTSISVTVIEKNRERCQELAALLPDTDIVFGDVSRQQLLESEGLAECDALVSLTGLDELNIVTSLFGHSMNVSQLITKLGRIENNGVLDTLPIGSIISPKNLCCNSIERYVRALQNQTGAAVSVHSIADGNGEAMEFRVDESTKNCGIPLKKLKLKKGVLLVCISRKGVTEIPSGDSSFIQGDTVIVVSGSDVIIRNINDIFM